MAAGSEEWKRRGRRVQGGGLGGLGVSGVVGEGRERCVCAGAKFGFFAAADAASQALPVPRLHPARAPAPQAARRPARGSVIPLPSRHAGRNSSQRARTHHGAADRGRRGRGDATARRLCATQGWRLAARQKANWRAAGAEAAAEGEAARHPQSPRAGEGRGARLRRVRDYIKKIPKLKKFYLLLKRRCPAQRPARLLLALDLAAIWANTKTNPTGGRRAGA